MVKLLTHQGLLPREFKRFVMKHSERPKERAKAMAEKKSIPCIPIKGRIRKEDEDRKIVEVEREYLPAGLNPVFRS